MVVQGVQAWIRLKEKGAVIDEQVLEGFESQRFRFSCIDVFGSADCYHL